MGWGGGEGGGEGKVKVKGERRGWGDFCQFAVCKVSIVGEVSRVFFQRRL